MRAAAAAGATGLLALLLLARNPPAELVRRVRFLRRTAALEPARRRLAGSSAAFDRPLFAFLESVRRTLPPSAAGVGLYVPHPSEAALYLAAYELAPRPVRLAPDPLPAGWVAAVYGPAPQGWTVVRTLPGGALLLPPAAR